MPMLVSGVAVGLVVGIVAGGDWRRLKGFDLRAWPVLVVAAAARLLAPLMGAIGVAASAVGIALIAVVAFVNVGLPGAALIGLGSALNLIVVAANGGMPVDPGAIAAAGKSMPSDGLHLVIDGGTRLPFLADVIRVPILNNIYSVGDFLVAAGGFWLSFRLVRP